jgi:ABC-type transporter MlaC component
MRAWSQDCLAEVVPELRSGQDRGYPVVVKSFLLIGLLTSCGLWFGGGEAAGRPCVANGDDARLAVELGFAELHRIHRSRVPGPSGEALLRRKVDALAADFVGLERFVDNALGEAWEKAPERHRDWEEILGNALRRRYLERLGSPIGVRLEMVSTQVDCDEVRVAFRLHNPRRKQPREVELRLFGEAPSETQDGTGHEAPSRLKWRAFDVAVDGVSLLETWRSRFRRVYTDGGVSAVEEQLRNLKERYEGDFP